MASFTKLLIEYSSGRISKEAFIQESYSTSHSVLHEISDQLNPSKIKSITISKNNIVAEIDGLDFKYALVKGDTRNCVVESLNFGGFEPIDSWIIYGTLQAISKNSSKGNVGVFFDVGSNNGWYSLYANTLPMIQVHAFEPIKETYNNLLINLALNEPVNINHYNFGLSDKAGIKTFYLDPAISGKSSIAKLPGLSESITERCKLEVLDNVVEFTKKPPHFIKIDVEGAEFSVIKGGLRLIKRHKPVIFIELLRKWAKEFGYHPQEVVDLLFSQGYRCFCSNESCKLVEITEITEITTATNFVFFNKNHNYIKEYLTQKELN